MLFLEGIEGEEGTRMLDHAKEEKQDQPSERETAAIVEANNQMEQQFYADGERRFDDLTVSAATQNES